MLTFDRSKRLQFVSRETFAYECKHKRINDNSFIISINDTEHEANEIKSLVLGYAPLCQIASFVFPDEEIGIPRETCDSIIKFTERAQRANAQIVVHCLAGISRSGAVAKFINEYLDIDDWFINCYMQYNKSIYNSLSAAAGMSLAALYEEIERNERKDFVK